MSKRIAFSDFKQLKLGKNIYKTFLIHYCEAVTLISFCHSLITYLITFLPQSGFIYGSLLC